MALRSSAGSGNYISRSLTGFDYNGAYTAFGWFRREVDTNTYAHFFALTGTYAYDGNVDFVGADVDGTTLRAGAVVGFGGSFPTESALPDATWFWLAMVRESATSLKIYRGTDATDGALAMTVTTNVSGRASATTAYVLDYNTAGTNGSGAHVRLWSGAALTLAELHKEAASSKPIRKANLWTAPAMTGATPGADRSGNARDWTVTGTLTESNPPLKALPIALTFAADASFAQAEGTIYELGNASSLPTYTAAEGRGWVSGIHNPRNRTYNGDLRLAGEHWTPSDGAVAEYGIDLPEPGTYLLWAALGDSDFSAGTYIQVYDDTTFKQQLATGATTAPNYFKDAKGVEHASHTAWANNHKPLVLSLTTKKLRLRCGNGTDTGGTLAWLKVQKAVPQVVGTPYLGGETTPVTVPEEAQAIVYMRSWWDSAADNATTVSLTGTGALTVLHAIPQVTAPPYNAGILLAVAELGTKGAQTFSDDQGAVSEGPTIGYFFVNGIDPTNWIRDSDYSSPGEGGSPSITLTTDPEDLLVALDVRYAAAPGLPAGWTALAGPVTQNNEGSYLRSKTPGGSSEVVTSDTPNFSSIQAVSIRAPAPSAPEVTSVSTSTPAQGASLTIGSAGGTTGFGATQGAGSVAFTNGGVTVNGTVTAWSDTSITVTVPVLKWNAAATFVVTRNDSAASSPYALTSIQPIADWAAITAGTLASPPSTRLTGTPDISSGNQIRYETVSGAVVVYDDGKWSALAAVTEFDFAIWVDGFGQDLVGTQYIVELRGSLGQWDEELLLSAWFGETLAEWFDEDLVVVAALGPGGVVLVAGLFSRKAATSGTDRKLYLTASGNLVARTTPSSGDRAVDLSSGTLVAGPPL